MSKLKWLDRGIVRGSHYFTLCTTEKLYHKAMKHLKIAKSERALWVNSGADATIHTFQSGKELSAVVCIDKCEDRELTEVYGILVHEAMHLWRYTKQAFGEHEPSFEFEAYAMQNLSQRLMEEYSRQTGRK